MTGARKCPECRRNLPDGADPRRIFCSDRCRKQSKRNDAVAAVVPRHGPMTAAVAAALEDVELDVVDRARAALALSLAQLVDGGSVPAAAQLRGVLNDMDIERPDLETLAFRLAVQTPRGRNWTGGDAA